MAETGREIRIGSIIHLKNGIPAGGYLDTRGRVKDKPVITKWPDPRIRAFVMTHKRADRDMGSGSWRVLSAEGKAVGEPLVVGDKVHLLNMYPGTGYLDSFEWVRNLEPFQDYPMIIGVFTADTEKRGGGPSGTWTVRSAAGKAGGKPVWEGDDIYLENDYPGAGYLHSYAKELVTDHPLFKEYDGQLKFVFTASKPTQEHGSHRWTVILSNLLENSYRVQYQWHDESAPWHDGGVFRFNGRKQKPVVALKLRSPDGGETLTGSVTFEGEPPADFTAKQLSQNRYAVHFTQADAGDPRLVDVEWLIGSRESQNVVALNVNSIDNGRSLHGTISYHGEGPIRFKGARETGYTLSQPRSDAARLDLLKGRSDKIEGVIDTTYKLLADAFAQISDSSLNDAVQKMNAGAENNQLDTVLTGLGEKSGQSDDIDRDFQLKQLLNLYTLSQNLNAFFRDTLQTLIKQSMEKHQQAGTPAPLHLIRRCFQRVATDHEIIQQATIQRQWNKHLDGRYYMSEQETELLIMDKLAIKAVAPFQHLLSDNSEHLAVITYLSERTHIHHAPYAEQFILIGLSYDRVPPTASLFGNTAVTGHNFPAAELMAIPHEMGHHIYQHGKFDSAFSSAKTFPEISKQFQDNPYYQWCEEIFADLYGCVVAGPLSALSMQALLISLDRKRFWKDDEEHPTPLLRVFLLAEMLHVLGEIESRKQGLNGKCQRYCFDKIKTKLDENWADILKRWGYERLDTGNGRPRRIYLPDPTASQLDKIVNMERVMQTVRPIIIEFAKHLLNQAKFDQPEADDDNLLSLAIPWSQDDTGDLRIYSHQMVNLRKRDFANKKTTYRVLPTTRPEAVKPDEAKPDKRLQRYLDEWGDSGPTGSGGGTYN